MRPPLDIDFSRRATARPPAGIALMTLGGLLLALASLAWWRADDSSERARAQFEQAAREDQAGRRPVRAQPTAAARLAEKQSEAVMRELTVPWQELLAIVEDYPARDVALIGIDQNPGQGQIRITAEAKDADGMIAYLKYLQHSVLLREAVLSNHLTAANVPGTPLRFQIVAVWRRP